MAEQLTENYATNSTGSFGGMELNNQQNLKAVHKETFTSSNG